MSSTPEVALLMETQKKILTEIENLRRELKNKDPSYFNSLQVSETSNRYTISGRIDPFLKDNIKVNFSEDKKYLIMVAVHETSVGPETTTHKAVKKFRIEGKYNLNTMQYQITDNFITITIEAEDQRFSKHKEAPEEQVASKKKGESVKIATDLDLDMTTTSEGELLPRYVVERTTIDPEVLQRRIEIPPHLHFPEIDEAYVQIREDELEPCPEFERQIDEMIQKRLEQKLAEKKTLAASQSRSVPEDTDTSLRKEKPVSEDMQSEKKAAVTSEKIAEQKSQEISDDSQEAAELPEDFKVLSSLSDNENVDEKRLEEKVEREHDDETQKKSTDEKNEEEVEDVEKSIKETKKKSVDEEQPETALREEEKQKADSLSESSKEKVKLQAKHEDEEKDKKKQKADSLSESSKEKGKLQAKHEDEEKDKKDLEKSECESPTKATKQERGEGEEEKVDKRESKKKEEKGLEVTKKDDADSEKSVPEIPAAASKQEPDEGEKASDKDSKVTVPEISPKVSKRPPDGGEEIDDKDSKETVPETPPKASKQQTDEGDKADSRETTPETSSNLPPTEEKQSGDRGEAKGKKKRRRK